MTSTEGGQSFAFRVADALELHGPNRGNKEYLSVNKVGKGLNNVGFKKEGEGRVGN